MPKCHKCGKLHTDLDSAGYCCYRPSAETIADSMVRTKQWLKEQESKSEQLAITNQDALHTQLNKLLDSM